MEFLPIALLSPVLVAVALSDLRNLRIPNALSLIAVAIFVLCAMAAPPPDLVARIIVAAAVFSMGFIAFALRLFGGGDVKILSALMLFVPAQDLNVFAFVFSASMLAGIAIVLALRRVPDAAASGWKSLEGTRKFPMGLSIAMAGLILPVVVLMVGKA